MSERRLSVGDVLVTTGKNAKSYRIIYMNEDVIEVCLMNVGKLELYTWSALDTLQKIQDRTITLEKKTNIVIDTAMMSDEEKKNYSLYKKICTSIDATYGPTYSKLATRKKKPELDKIVIEFNINKETLRRLCIRYLQSGMDDSACLDNRHTTVNKQDRKDYTFKKRPGRQTDDVFASKVVINAEIRKQFDMALAERKSGRCKTYESAYSWLVNKFYSETYMDNGELVIRQKSEAKIPTIRQFTNYARKHISQRELDIVSTSAREVRNDKRLLLGDTFNDVLGAGDLVEIDAVEVDVSLVSSANRKQAIGRPIMYVMIDVYTRMIIAMSVSLHNNAMLALTNLFLNLSDDKKTFCEKYGFTINDDAWISNIIPKRIRVDRGSDFASNQFGEICEELGIDRQLAPAAMGSFKGSIEQEFRTLHAVIKPHLDGKGVISKRYDSNHHEQAVMTIEEFTQMAVDFVLHHNTMTCSDYPYTAEMVAEGVHAIPAELWSYSTRKYGSPRPIINLDAFRYALMIKAQGVLDRTGITVKGLSYVNTHDADLIRRMYGLQNKREKMEIRIDPRSVSEIYYLKDGKLTMAKLNPAKTGNMGYENMTLFELEELNKKERQIKKEGAVRNRRAKNSLFATEKAIVQSAVASTPVGKKETKNLREVRNEEKQRVAKANSIAGRLEPNNTPQIENVVDAEFVEIKETPQIEEKKTLPASGLEGFKEAMNLFNDEV